LIVVWQQEEWIKANVTKDGDGEQGLAAEGEEGTGDVGAKELAEEATRTAKPEINRRGMRGLEFAQEH
jgi:hypothetical protein